MKPKKTRHPGIYLLDDGRYLARWTVRQGTTRQDREHTLDLGQTIEDAIELRASRVRDAKGAPPPKPAEPPLLGAYVQSWLAQRAPGMKHSARESYAQVLEDHVLPQLGTIRVDRITRDTIQGWVAWAEAQTYPRTRAAESERVPYSRDTLLGWWAKVKQIVRDACADHGCPDPTARVQPPKAYGRRRVHEDRTLTGDELRQLLDEIPEGWVDEVTLIALTGLRPGELYAIQWSALDTGRGALAIDVAHVDGHVAAPKTGKTREIILPAATVQRLAARRREMMETQHPALESGLMFPASESGKKGWHRDASALLNQLVRSGRRAGLDVHVTPQVLRRTVNTLLVGEGVDRLVQRAIMGHSSEAMTARYHHAGDGAKLAAVTSLADRVGR